MEFVLRDYQEEASNKIVELFNSEKGGKELFVLPTGSGKSLIIADAVKNFGGPVLIIQPSKELLVQNYRKFKSFGGEATICCASLKEKTVDGEDYFEIEPGEWKKCREISEVTFATVGTVKKYIEELEYLKVNHVVIDETHIGSRKGSQLRKLINKLKIRHVAGLTATPLYLEGGMNGSRLIMMNRAQHTIFRKISYVSQISEMVKRKFWSPLKYEIHDQDESSLKLNSSGSDFTDNSMRTFYRDNDIETSIINEVNKQLKEGRKRILIFMPSIEDAENLHNLIPVKSGIVHSKMSMKERDENVRMFGNGDIKIMINVNVLSVGYDNTLIDSIITGRPTSSMEIYLQQIGRGVRIHPNKKDCKIVDFSGNVKRFGNIEEFHFEDLEGYGWGIFNGKNELLTDYPIQSKIRPTKETLIQAHEEKLAIQRKEDLNHKITFYFGKFKGKTLGFVYKYHKDYLVWIADQENFNWYGKKGEALRNAIFKKLMLPIPQGHFEIDECWRDKKEEEEDNKLDKLLEIGRASCRERG